ncbi:MAG: ASKHA domain-containing protein [Dehalococcoidales bacterium]
MTDYVIDFQPIGRRGQCQAGESILDCGRRLQIGIGSICGGKGTCGKCKVRILSGSVSEPTSSEVKTFSPQEISDGWRFACQVHLSGDIKLYLPPESMTTPQRMQLEGLEIEVPIELPVKAFQVKLDPPSLSDQRADEERLLAVLNREHQLNCDKLDYGVLKNLSPQLRAWDSQFQVTVREEEVVAISPGGSRQLGFGVDLGSTKIAGYIVDLEDGSTLAARGIMNPQISYGEDVISRIAVASSSPEKALEIQSLVTGALDNLAGDLCSEIGAEKGEIVESVVVANTAMHHLFLGLPVRQLALNPFVPVVSRALDIKARQLDLHFAEGAYVHLLPNIAMFVGSDHVAMLLATEACREEGPLIAIDIGTNTEVSLIYKGRITSASCASGPALEGGHIKDGMRAASGAIERVRITKDKTDYQTIDDAPPVGICGSGILDTIAQLYLAGIVDGSGRMQENHPQVRNSDKGREFVLVEEKKPDGNPAIVFTQQDVRQIQLGKAAIRSGIQMLLEDADCQEDKIKQVIIAGAFGSYIDVANVIAIGMLPSLPLERFRQVGNAAGMGAKRALISLSQRAEARAIAGKVRHIELSSAPYFNRTFTQTMYLGQYRMKKGEREELS